MDYEVALDEIGVWRDVEGRDRGPAPLAAVHARDAGASHEPLDVATSDVDALVSGLGVDARRSIGAAAAFVDGPDLDRQNLVGERTGGLRTGQPGLEAGLRDAEHPAHGCHLVVGLLRLDQSECHRWRRLSSEAKKAAGLLTGGSQ